MPLAVWLGGQLVLGPYYREPLVPGAPIVNSGPLLLWADFFRGLASGSLGYWCAALGPYVIYLVVRLLPGRK